MTPADTIVAIASPPGGAERGIVRVSGARALELLARVFRGGALEASRRVEGTLVLEGWPEVALSAWVFKAPRSYTGEDACELHVPGSPPLLAALVRAFEKNGARTAARGEFTRRAFLNGRIDLSRAEAIAALANAEAEGEARAAARALQGGLARTIDAAKARVLDALAHVEATIDFPEEDLPGLAPAEKIALEVERAASDLGRLSRRSLRPRVARTEPVVVIAGAANAGKSTLLNALAGREAALVSPHAGTTRDPVSAVVELRKGVRALLVDTAGEKTAAGSIEEDALARAREAAASADLVLYVFDLSRPEGVAPAGALVVGNKVDAATPSPRAAGEGSGWGDASLHISALTGRGLDALRAELARRLEQGEITPDLVQTERQSRLVETASRRLDDASRLLRSSEPARLELSAVDLRAALEALGELTGAVATDDLLDRIFAEFCVGK
jgi:tRNA modification GTPase